MRRLIALLFLLGFSRIHAEPLRVTTWNLNFSAQAPTTATDRLRLTNIASILGALNADVIQLQEVPDRQTCERLAALLKPSHYQVAACSAFTDISGGNFELYMHLTILKRELAAWQLVQYIRCTATELTDPAAAVLIGGSLSTNP